jgi:hypothetical protein
MTKISQLTNIGSALAGDDEFVVRDVSDISTPNKKATSSGIIDYIISQGALSGFSQIAAGVGPLARVRTTTSGTTGTIIAETASAGTIAEAYRVTPDKYFRMAAGTLGIQFNGDTAAANALNDYEEGTWTPTYLTDLGNPAYTITTNDSVYTKIGRLVTLRWYVVISGQTGVGGGNLRVRDIPFVPASTEYIVGRGGYTSTNTAPDVRTSWTGFDVVSDAGTPRSLFLKGLSATSLLNTVAFFTVTYRV